MKKRIEQLLNGKFEYEVSSLKLSEESIELTAKQGEIVHGSFSVSHPEEKKVRGFLYSSNPRVTFDPLEFYGAENKIYYQVDTSGLQPGEETDGGFTLCTDLGEYFLPYVIKVKKRPAAKIGSGISGVRELADLTRRDFQRAYPIFVSPEFEQVLRETDQEALALYEALKTASFSYQSLEEFLIGCGEKEPVELSLENVEAEFRGLDQSTRESIRVRKSSWGFLRMDISSDCRFLRPEKKVVTTDEFVGNQYVLDYIIDTNFLHAGRNYGRIKVSTCYQTLCFEVLVVKDVKKEEMRELRVQKLMRRKLESLYVDFRLKRIEMQSWIDRSQNVISSYKRAGGTDVFADLFLVQLLFADEKRTKGYKLLQEIESCPELLDTPERYSFYLYISTFFHRDIAYVDQVEARIEQMFLQNRDNWVLQWILLYLQERLLKDDSAKLEAIAEQVKYGCSSQIMYLEALLILKKNPFLLRRLNSFEQKVLKFAVKENLLTEDLAEQAGNLALHQRTYNKTLFEILTAGYQVTGSQDILKAICTILIAGEKKDAEYFEWYALGVSNELRITGLYEYYMETMDECGIEKMPQIIRMYFIYNNTLDYHKRAAIYRDISDNRDSVPQVYRSYRGAIEKFLMEQLEMGRIDENLAILYERYLNKQILNRSLAERLVRLLFTFEVTCKNPNMKSIVVAHRGMKGETVVPLNDGRAQVQIYTEDARILLMDGEGNRYASTELYMAERMLDTPRLLEYCMELVPEHPGLVLYMCGMRMAEQNEAGADAAEQNETGAGAVKQNGADADAAEQNETGAGAAKQNGAGAGAAMQNETGAGAAKQNEAGTGAGKNSGAAEPGIVVTKQTLPYFKRACEMETLKEEYRQKYRKWVLDYYMEHPDEDDLFQYLKDISYADFVKADKTALLALLTQEGMYEEAFILLEMYGSEQVPLDHLVRICSQTVLAREYEENAVLLSYCHQCYDYGKYDDNILTYLLMYYDGPIEDMKRLWNTGRQFELDTMLLEEKILSLLLFTRTGTSGTEQIFASYQRKLGRRKICRAYLVLKSYEYFVKDLPVSDVLFEFIERACMDGAELEDVSRLALLRYYSRQMELKESQEWLVKELLARYNGQGIRFAFYQSFPKSLRQPYQLEDKVFLEYVANPESTVLLHYRLKGKQEEFVEEPMKNCFEGIYVKEFILFYGDELECYTEELCGDRPVKTSGHRILTAVGDDWEGSGRYELVNRMIKAGQNGDEASVKRELETYCQLDYLTKEIFTLI